MGEIKRIFAYAHDYKNKLYVAILLVSISVFIGIIPYYLVYKIIMRFIGDNPVTIEYVLILAGSILLCLVLKSFFFLKAMSASHEVAFDTLMGMRKQLTDKMINMP
ncbi:MAG: ABC transporter ATP-binding protein, partial [Clostridia bacterium]|nr:ABC transporter ATP-binding protein [Clostridia bacterium]